MKKIFSIVLILVISLALNACEGSSDSSNATKASSSNSESSEKKTSEEYTQEAVDFANSVHLEENFKGKEFVADGIGEVTLTSDGAVDGDTIHVMSNDVFLEIRFLGVDTRESTGVIQPWGKPASNYTKDKVEKATSIVLQSDVTGPAKTESNGRYLAWVWILSPDKSEYVCLNLLLIAESFSQAKGTSNSRYSSESINLNTIVVKANIRINNNDDHDPLFFYGEAISVDLKEIRTNSAEYYGKKVKFEAVVTNIDGYNVYVVDTDKETGTKYAISIFTSYKSYSVLSIGNRTSIVGTLSKYMDSYQITGISFDQFKAGPNDMQLISEGNKVEPILLSSTDLNLKNNPDLECNLVELKNVKVTDVYVTESTTSSNGQMTITGLVDGNTVKIRTKVLKKADGTYVTKGDYLDKTISVKGLVVQYSGSYQILVISFTNIDFLN